MDNGASGRRDVLKLMAAAGAIAVPAARTLRPDAAQAAGIPIDAILSGFCATDPWGTSIRFIVTP